MWKALICDDDPAHGEGLRDLLARDAQLRVSCVGSVEALEQEMASQISGVVSESGFQWPLPASWNTLSSLFGTRTDPFTGRAGNHTGIDIPASRNTEIGVVITSTYNSGGYGQYIVISHSDGTSTLYAHMVQGSQRVSVGDVVSQGQVIGGVGTTGRSTGNHLHFEVRINGTRVDPIDYFPDMTLYYRSGGRTTLLDH